MRDDLVKEALASLSPEFVSLVGEVGLAKVAATMTGIDFNSERSAYEHIGTQLFTRRKEAALIARGVRALKAIGER